MHTNHRLSVWADHVQDALDPAVQLGRAINDAVAASLAQPISQPPIADDPRAYR